MLSAVAGSGRTKQRKRRGRPPVHGAASLNRVLRGIRLDQVDGRSQAGVYLRRTFDDLAAQVGGLDQLAPTQLLLLETMAKRQLLVHVVQEWVLAQPTLVLAPVVGQLAQLEDGLCKMFDRLGYERKARDATAWLREVTAPALPTHEDAATSAVDETEKGAGLDDGVTG